MVKRKTTIALLVILVISMVGLCACSSFRGGLLDKLTSEESKLIQERWEM